MTESRLKSDFTQFSTSAFCSLPHGQEIVLASQLPHNTTLTSVVYKVETSAIVFHLHLEAIAFQNVGNSHTGARAVLDAKNVASGVGRCHRGRLQSISL